VKDLFFDKKFGWLGALFVRSSLALKLRGEALAHCIPWVRGELEICFGSRVLPHREDFLLAVCSSSSGRTVHFF